MGREEPFRGKWRKSRYCDGGSCVEVAQARPGMVAVRDNDDPSGRPLLFSSASWLGFVLRARRGGFAPRDFR
jgi:hypothetical protein